MNVFQRLGAALFPKRAAARQRSMGYDAVDPRNPANANIFGPDLPAEMLIELEGDRLRDLARQLERNSDVINAVINAIIRNIIGLGFQLQAHTPRETLNNELEELWREWCRPRNCDATGNLGFTGLMEMILRRKIVDGGVLIHKVFTRGGPCRFCIQVIEVDAFAEPLRPTREGHSISKGVEVDRFGRPVGYWVAPWTPDEMSTLEPHFVSEKDAIFYFTKKRPTQIREISDLAPVLQRVRDANEFAKNVSEKQKTEAMFAAYIARHAEADTLRGSFLDDPNDKAAEERRKRHYTTIAPGMIFDLDMGETMGTLNPTGQATDAASFMKLLLRLIASGMGLSYEAVSRDMSGVNYSSARQSAIEDEVSFASTVAQFMDVLREIYETFVISCVQSGAVDIPDFWDPKRKRAYLAHTWVKVPKRWVDPKKEAEANVLLLQAGLKSLPEALGEMGADWQESINTIAEVVKYGDKKGVDIGRLIYDGKLGGQSDPAQNEGTSGNMEHQSPDAGADTDDRTEGVGSPGTDGSSAGAGRDRPDAISDVDGRGAAKQ